MKITIEWFLLMFMTILFFEIGLFYMNAVFVHNSALQLEEYALNLIEHHNAVDSYVYDELDKVCPEALDYHIHYVEADDRYTVSVDYQVNAPFTHTIITNTIYSMVEN